MSKTVLSDSLYNPFVFKYFEEDFPQILNYECSLDRLYQALGISTCRLLLYITTTLSKSKQDYLSLNPEELKKLFGLNSSTSVYNAINQLLEVKIIQKKSKSQYWVNPQYINHKLDWKETYRTFARDEHPSIYINHYANH